MKTLKEKISKFKETERCEYVFLFCAIFPFFLTDILLRFVINFIPVFDFKYYVIPILFNISWISVLFYLCYGILPKIAGKILYTIIYSVFGIWFMVNYIYYCIFGQYMWFKTITLAGEGLDYVNQALPYIDFKFIVVFIIYIAFLTATLVLWKEPPKTGKITKYTRLLLPVIFLGILEGFVRVDTSVQIRNGAWEIWSSPVLVYKNFTDANKSLNVCGFYQFTFKSIFVTIFDNKPIDVNEKKHCDEFFANHDTAKTNKMTGILKDKNVIFVLMESLDDWLINDEYTPTIKYMVDNGISFENHYMPNVGSGYTFNSEFSMNTGFICPSNISSASVFTSNSFPYAMPNRFKDNGYNTNSFHFNSKNFYNRQSMHSKMGYNHYYCLNDYMSYDDCILDSNIAQNKEITELMTQDKFFSFYISYSCHLPYDSDDKKTKLLLEKYPHLKNSSLDEETRNIFISAHDTDEFFRILINNLKKEGMYEDTVIIGVADHYAYGYMDKEKLKQYTINSGSKIYEKVPFFIFSPSLEPQKVTKVTGAIDIVPTILNLFGLNTEYCLGNDAFNPEYNGFVYYPNNSWYDGNITFNSNERIERSIKEQEYVDKMNKHITNLNKINDFVINNNYFGL